MSEAAADVIPLERARVFPRLMRGRPMLVLAVLQVVGPDPETSLPVRYQDSVVVSVRRIEDLESAVDCEVRRRIEKGWMTGPVPQEWSIDRYQTQTGVASF